jgi:hypothetical protein
MIPMLTRRRSEKSHTTWRPLHWTATDGNPKPSKHCRKPPRHSWCTFSRTPTSARYTRNESRSCRKTYSLRDDFVELCEMPMWLNIVWSGESLHCPVFSDGVGGVSFIPIPVRLSTCFEPYYGSMIEVGVVGGGY